MFNSQKNLYKKLLGKIGEDLTAKTLKKQGYKVLLRNYVTPYGEADIVALKEETLVFVEVKTRSNDKFGTPAQAVDYKKQQKYQNIANYYINQNNLEEVDVSFAVAEVVNGKVNLITDAF